MAYVISNIRVLLERLALATFLFLGLALTASPATAQMMDEHSVEAITAALQSPIPLEVQQQAQELDDQLLASGQAQGANVYLVTDDRLTRATALTRRLLQAIGQNPDAWVVRVLYTNPVRVNAFVFGGRYVYVYAGLLDYVRSDDELAFVLAHELGHSLLQHEYRRSHDLSTAVADVAVLIGTIWKSNRQAFYAGASGITAAYSRQDEEEADAIGVAIARRAGFDPLQGAAFFSRLKFDDDEAIQSERQSLAQSLAQVQQFQAACANDQQLYRYPQYQTPANYQLVMSACQSYQALAARYNQAAQSFNIQFQQRSVASIFSDHPSYDDRVAAIAAVSDFLAGRRNIESLQSHQQSYRVMAALGAIGSPLLTQ